MAQFLSRDPMWSHPRATQYGYVDHAPYNQMDPTGGLAWLLLAPIGGALVGGWSAVWWPGRAARRPAVAPAPSRGPWPGTTCYDTPTGTVVMEPRSVAQAHRANIAPGASGHMAVGDLHDLPRGSSTLGFSAVKGPEGPDVFYPSAYNMTAMPQTLQSSDQVMMPGPAAMLERQLQRLRPPGSTLDVGGPSTCNHERAFFNRWFNF